jgi:TldD protein
MHNFTDFITEFSSNTDINESNIKSLVDKTLFGMEDGELFLEIRKTENLVFDDGKLKTAGINYDNGYGLRGVCGEFSAYAYGNQLNKDTFTKASEVIKAANLQSCAYEKITTNSIISNYYGNYDHVDDRDFKDKVKLLIAIDEYIRSKSSKVRQVSASLVCDLQKIAIIKPYGEVFCDIRPLLRLQITVALENNGLMETGSYGVGGRQQYEQYIDVDKWQNYADNALKQAEIKLQARPAPAGEFPVVLGNGWPGVLLHEAVGHGLEGDFNRKQTSAFASLIGKQVAASGVTIVDDGTIVGRRGSINIDDEGTAGSYNVLIENGILKGYMQDRLNARLMGVKPTGNGRRENYSHQPLPRMTNTYMLAGDIPKEELFSSITKGIYAANFAGGQVDITSGKFVFSASEAYMIENGKISYPIKGATLIGNGPEVMKKVIAVGNDLKLDDGIGTCGKKGQSIPVGVGQPSLLISSITVGGTEV